MTQHNRQIGAWGEQVAVEYLLTKGHKVVARNVRTPYGEIDIIAKQNFFPEHNITPRKREPMLACAQHYSAENEVDHWQIDVIAIEGKSGKEPTITYFENAIT